MEELMKIEGLDDAIVGVASRAEEKIFLCTHAISALRF